MAKSKPALPAEEAAPQNNNELVTIIALRDLNTTNFGTIYHGKKAKVTRAFANCLIEHKEAAIVEE